MSGLLWCLYNDIPNIRSTDATLGKTLRYKLFVCINTTTTTKIKSNNSEKLVRDTKQKHGFIPNIEHNPIKVLK